MRAGQDAAMSATRQPKRAMLAEEANWTGSCQKQRQTDMLYSGAPETMQHSFHAKRWCLGTLWGRKALDNGNHGVCKVCKVAQKGDLSGFFWDSLKLNIDESRS
jgi:hypothetical protein